VKNESNEAEVLMLPPLAKRPKQEITKKLEDLTRQMQVIDALRVRMKDELASCHTATP